MKRTWGYLIAAVFILSGSIVWYSQSIRRTGQPNKEAPINPVSYQCNEAKSITAAFFKNRAAVKLSDGRVMDLPQTISADGGRYANSDETFVFWIKGNGALVLENNQEKSYIGCMVTAADPGGLANIYSDGSVGFSVRYPADYSLDKEYKYQALGPGKEISGVKFVIPKSMAAEKNLSAQDSGVSVEYIPQTQTCNAGLFLGSAAQAVIKNDSGREFSYATTSEAAVGNKYEEEVWAIPETNPCVAVRYFIHSTNIANYPTGQATEFNRRDLTAQFDKIRRTLVIR